MNKTRLGGVLSVLSLLLLGVLVGCFTVNFPLGSLIATGFELNGDVIGRPVDVAEGPDGALYISDDYAGVIYRVDHRGG